MDYREFSSVGQRKSMPDLDSASKKNPYTVSQSLKYPISWKITEDNPEFHAITYRN